MKYRVKRVCLDDNFNGIMCLLFWWAIPFLNFSPTWDIQYKKHWWNKWKTCDSYDRLEDAYRYLLLYTTNNQCNLPAEKWFPHNRIKGKKVRCELTMGKLNTNDLTYNEGKHYYAGYKPKNYARFYFCTYGISYEDAIGKLWCDLEVQKSLHKVD